MSFFWTDRLGNINMLIKVVPNAKKNALKEVCDAGGFYPVAQALKIHLAVPPVDGKANNELLRFLSDMFSVRLSDISIESGDKSRLKLVRFDSMPDEGVLKKLERNKSG